MVWVSGKVNSGRISLLLCCHHHDIGKIAPPLPSHHAQLTREVRQTSTQCSNEFTAARGGFWNLTWPPIEAKILTLSMVPMPRPLTLMRTQLPADAHLSRAQTPKVPSISFEPAVTMDATPFSRCMIRPPQKPRTSPSA